MNHEYYNIEFLHRNYFGPPSPKAYAPVMVAATVPAITLILYATGTLERLRALVRRFVPRPGEPASLSLADQPRDRALTDVLLFLSFCAPLAVFFLPKTPIFGGTKHWLPAYPFLAIFAGWFNDFTELFGVGTLIVMAPFAVTQHSHPFGLSAYVPIVGGTAGGADLGLCRQFWGFTTESVEPYFEKNAPPNARVFIHDTAWDSWYRMTAEKRIRPDLQAVGSPGEAQIGLLHHELHMNEVDFQEWAAFETTAPDWVLAHDGVPIVSVYRRK